MSDDINQKIPVYIANLAVSNLEQKIATLESKNQILRQEYTALVHERGESIKKLEDENERLRKAGDFMFRTIDENITVEEYEWIAEIESAWNAAKEGGRK